MRKVLEDFTKSVEEVASQTIKKVQSDIKNTEDVLLQEVKRVPTKVQEQLVTQFEQMSVTSQKLSHNLHQTFQDGQRKLRQEQKIWGQELTHRVEAIPTEMCQQLYPRLQQVQTQSKQLSQDIQQTFQDGQKRQRKEQRIWGQELTHRVEAIPTEMCQQLDPRLLQVQTQLKQLQQTIQEDQRVKLEEVSQEVRGVTATFQSDKSE